jgi:HK97 family phage major capsid protein
MSLEDLKPLIEEGNKTISAIRSEMDGVKAADVVTDQKLARMEIDLATSLAAKQAGELAQKALEARLAEIETKVGRPGGPVSAAAADEHKAAFLDYMRKGANGGADQRLFSLQEKAADVRVAVGASGGFALPKVIAAQIMQQIQDISPIRQIARVVQTGTTDYHELVDSNGFGGEWVGEIGTRTLATATPNLNDVVPTFGEISAVPEATRHSINDLFFDVEAWLADRGAQMFAITEGTAFVSGNGTNRPTGFLAGPAPVLTADAARAFGTLQAVITGQAAALATNPFDTFKDLQYTLKAGYRAGARWVMNSIVLATLAKVKDTTGQYLLTPAVSAADSDTIDGKAITIAEDMPNIGAGTFPVAFGDFSKGYLIADIPGIWMARDEITKVGWVRLPMAKRVGGRLLDTNAIKLMRVSAT